MIRGSDGSMSAGTDTATEASISLKRAASAIDFPTLPTLPGLTVALDFLEASLELEVDADFPAWETAGASGHPEDDT